MGELGFLIVLFPILWLCDIELNAWVAFTPLIVVVLTSMWAVVKKRYLK